MGKKNENREGVLWGDYRTGPLIASLLPGVFVYFLQIFLRPLARDLGVDSVEEVPPNAIVSCYHGETHICYLAWRFWEQIDFKGGRWYWLGYHGFKSYASSLWAYAIGMKSFRYDRTKRDRPLEQIVSFLKAHPNVLFGVRTDSGGPYGRVRESLVKMALATGRPVVGVRHVASRTFSVNSHELPWPGCRIRTVLTRVFTVEELRNCSIAEARDRIQYEMDNVVESVDATAPFVERFS